MLVGEIIFQTVKFYQWQITNNPLYVPSSAPAESREQEKRYVG